jgi:hypothetical protein
MSSAAAVLRLLNRRRLRAIYLAVRDDATSVDAPRDADTDLLDLTSAPYESLAGARDRLESLGTLLRQRGDRRAVFLSIYAHMTRAVQRSIERGVFADPDWMRAYTVTFANYYREAFLAFEEGRLQAVPEPWRIAFGTAVAGDALVVQDAFLGINAHINYDLALTLRDVGLDPKRAEKRADHRAINDILARLIDAQQDALSELYAPGIDDVDAMLGRFDETVSLFSLTESRKQAWRVGVLLHDFDVRPIEAYARWLLRTTATGSALFVLSPTLAPEAMHAFERVEQGQFALGNALELLHSRLEAVEFG